MLLLDTDHMTAIERDGSAGQQLRVRLRAATPESIATTIISYEEQTRGWLSTMAKARTPDMQVEVYRRLKKHLETYCRIPVVDFDEQAADVFRRLKQARIRIGTMDLKIASIALSNDATLLTRNLSDFNRVPNLRAENWID